MDVNFPGSELESRCFGLVVIGIFSVALMEYPQQRELSLQYPDPGFPRTIFFVPILVTLVHDHPGVYNRWLLNQADNFLYKFLISCLCSLPPGSYKWFLHGRLQFPLNYPSAGWIILVAFHSTTSPTDCGSIRSASFSAPQIPQSQSPHHACLSHYWASLPHSSCYHCCQPN